MWRALDLGLRLLYCTLVPIAIAAVYILIPIGGIVVGAALATAIAVGGAARWRAATARIPVIGRLLGGLANLGSYYDEHPPRPLLYYVFYPLLAPYWLISRPARQEFLLYRKLNVLVVAVLVVGGVQDYLSNWQPDLGLGLFLRAGLATFLLQLLVLMAAVMPLVTTVIRYHQGGHRKLMMALAVLGAISTAGAVAFAVKDPHVQKATELRLRHRAELDPARTQRVLEAGLAAARAALPPDAPAGSIDGAPRAAARDALEALWKPDEARAFRLWWSGPPDGTLMLYFVPWRKPPIVAADAGHRITFALDQLPPAAQDVIRRAASR